MAKAQPKQLQPYSFKPGQPGGPGRPQGARSKLQEMALRFLAEDFSKHGQETIVRVREKKPDVYLAAVVSLLPKQAEKIASPFVDLSDDELEHLEQLLAALRAKTVNALAQQHNEMPRAQHRNGRTNTKPEQDLWVERTLAQMPTSEQPTLNDHGNSADRESREPSALLDSDASASDTGSAVSQDSST